MNVKKIITFMVLAVNTSGLFAQYFLGLGLCKPGYSTTSSLTEANFTYKMGTGIEASLLLEKERFFVESKLFYYVNTAEVDYYFDPGPSTPTYHLVIDNEHIDPVRSFGGSIAAAVYLLPKTLFFRAGVGGMSTSYFSFTEEGYYVPTSGSGAKDAFKEELTSSRTFAGGLILGSGLRMEIKHRVRILFNLDYLFFGGSPKIKYIQTSGSNVSDQYDRSVSMRFFFLSVGATALYRIHN